MNRCSLPSYLLGLLVPTVAYGHANLVSPTPRLEENIKISPCGGADPGASVATYTAGELVEVEWEETVDHPGYYRLAISPQGVDGFAEIILEDNIPDIGGEIPLGTTRPYTRMVQMPDRSCSRCSLQLIQAMTENPLAPEYYYSCSDITIEGGPPDDEGEETPAVDGGSTSRADAGSGGSSVDDSDPMLGPGPGVCSIGAPSSRSERHGTMLGLGGLLLLLVVASPRIGAKVSGITRRSR
jgi:hypothetical protein